MARRMLINAVEPEEIRIAVVEGKTLQEYYVERASSSNLLGNIYKGRVVSVEPSIQAAFVDFGTHTNGFLHVSDVMPAYGRGLAGKDNGGGRRERRPDIQELLRKGQEVLVQVSKEEIGSKVPTLTTYISLPGRYMVLMPSIGKRGVSKKIEDEEERRHLRQVLAELNPPKGMGCIIRTAGAGHMKSELAADLNYLLKLWKAITTRVRQVRSPALIYQETDLVLRAMRDLVTDEIDEIVFDTQEACERAKQFFAEAMPAFTSRVRLHAEPIPLFERHGVEPQIERLYEREVRLPSGGSIVIEQTEALVAIDVNSGKSKLNDNLEDTAYKTNLEAVREIARQLRLRDLGGVICIDFIDMRSERYRAEVERQLREALRKDRARTRVARMSKFCILEMTRQRVRMSIRRTHYRDCPMCAGSGSIKTPESMGLQVVRQLRGHVVRYPGRDIEVKVHPEVAAYLNGAKRETVRELEQRLGRPIAVLPDESLNVDEVRMTSGAQARDRAGGKA
ncbi:MAG: ribonuclease E [Planctomycetota bacterium]|nr:MAG: ribonuclease E [Planctomycetota bacterium]